MKMKKMLCSMLCFALFLTMASAAFATDGVVPSAKEGESVELIEEVVKSGILEASKVIIADMSMMQPKEIKAGKEAIMEDNSILSDRNTAVDISVSPLQKEEAGVSLIGNKTLVEIKNASAPKQYSFSYDLPNGYRMMKSEDYFYEQKKVADKEDLVFEKGWIYILDGNDEIFAVIDPAEATDAEGNNVKTHYEISGTTLIQMIDFNEGTTFPIIAAPTSTRPTNHKLEDAKTTCTLSNTEIGAGCFVVDGGTLALTTAGKSKLTELIVKKCGSKFIPIVSVASWVVTGYTVVTGLAGYSSTKVTIGYEVWAYYKHQGGRWVEGRQYKNPKITLKLIK